MSEENQLIRTRINSFSSSLSNESATTSMAQKSSTNGSLLCPPEIKHRKHSLPLIVPNQISPNQYLETYSRDVRKSFPSSILESLDITTQKHRLSQVGIAVSQHLSSTIGLKLYSGHKQIVKQSECLCSRIIRNKLKKKGLVHKRINLQRIKSMCSLRVDSDTNLVAIQLNYLIQELERTYPKLFGSVVNNIRSHSFKTINEYQSVLQVISQELFRNDITWARIAALYAITGALAVDSVQSGHPEYIIPIIDTLTAFVDRDIAGLI